MSKIEVEPIYISSGCNRCPKALDWGGKQDQLITAVSNSIALFSNKEPFEIKCTFNNHTDKVNCVKWINFNEFTPKDLFSRNEFISASKDKTIVLWQGTDLKYEAVDKLEGHTNNICVVDGMYYKNDSETKPLDTYLASASVDSTVRIWRRESGFDLKENKFSLQQVITSKMNGFALAIKFYMLPISNLPLLLIGYENHKIEISVRLHNVAENTDKFYCLHTLIGHEDWIRDIDVCQISSQQLLIATSSQDNYIRLWKLDSNLIDNKSELNNQQIMIEENSVKSEAVIQTNDEEDEELPKPSDKIEEELRLKSSLFTCHSNKLNKYVQYSMNLESVLYGHEDWIYTVKFHPRVNNVQPLILISASIDKTIVVWKYDEQNSIWIDVAKAGDIGGNTLGFYGAAFEPNGQYIIAHGYQGALHLWKRNPETESLVAGIVNGGHFDLVEDICWEPESQFLISTSKDQTTRFHSYWKNPQSDQITWHEFGRPQIHGYDLTCVAFLERFKFVSGADEKLLRIFESPKVFLQNLYKLNKDESLVQLIKESTKLGASVPALGLSNKAIYEENQNASVTDKKGSLADELYKEVYFNIIDLTKPPSEEHLLQNTLWPETQKLYGHGFEIFSVAVETKSKIIASACKATKPEHASIILWKEINNNFKQICSLKGHELTIVQMKFSNNGHYLLSVSRDRSWKMFSRKPESNNNQSDNQYELFRFINSKNSYHTRIIWSCDWSNDDKYFVTTSRDKRVCIWYGVTNENYSPGLEDKPISTDNSLFLELESAVTACSFAPCLIANNYFLAFGLESGKILFYSWNLNDGFKAVGSVENRFKMANNFPGYVINNTTIAVDYWPRANNSHITHYFLTHAHTDHTKGLDETWNGPVLYCSNITKKLIISLLNIPEEYIIGLEMNQPHIMRLDANETFNITLIDANHCAGAVMYLFEGYFGTILSTGDFRYAANMFEDTALENKQVDICYLDNTYLNSTYSNIPLRNEATEELIQLIKVKIKNNSNIIFAIIMKNLGKEDMLIQIAKTFDTKILISTKRFERYTNALSLDGSYFTTAYNSSIFICADDSDLNIAHNIKDRKLIRIKPSALDYACEKRPKRLQVVIDLYSKSISTYYNVPYTDHSSFNELIDFVKFLKPKLLIPIVPQLKEKNINNTDISHLSKYLNNEPLIDSSDKFKQILESTSSIRLNPTFKMPIINITASPLMETKRKLRPRPSELFLYQSRYQKRKSIKHKTEIEYESSPEKNSKQKSDVVELRVLRSNRRLSEAIPLISVIPTRIDENDKENSVLSAIFEAKMEQEQEDESEDDLDINESIHLDHLKSNTICSTNIDSTKSSEQILISEDVIQDESFINMLKAASKRGSVSDKQSIDQEENQIEISIVKNNLNQSESLAIKHTQKSDDEETDQNDISRLDLSLTFTENETNNLLTDNIQLSDNENETRSEKINTETAIIVTTVKPNRNPAETTTSSNESNEFFSSLSARLIGIGVKTKQENLGDKLLKFLMNSFEK